MVKNPKHGNRKKEKGITLLETIIALGIIVIVSLAAVTINVSASSAMNNNRIKNFFVREMNTIAKLYSTYWAKEENHASFCHAIEAYTNRDITPGNPIADTEFYYTNTFEATSSAEKSFYLVLDFDFPAEGSALMMTSYRADGSELFKKEVHA